MLLQFTPMITSLKVLGMPLKMEIKLKIGDKEEIVKINSIGGKLQLEYYKELQSLDNSEGDGYSKAILAIEMQNKWIFKLCPRFKNAEEILDLNLEERDKLFKPIVKRITGQEFVEATKN